MIVSVCNQKGGVGKSTIACNLAVCEASKGKSVLLVDADSQGSSSQWVTIRDKKDIALLKAVTPKDLSKLPKTDTIIIDSGGRDNNLFRASMLAADIVLMPLLASASDLWATQDTVDVLRQARSINAKIKALALFNAVSSGRLLTAQARAALTKLCTDADITVLDITLGYREIFRQAFQSGVGVVEMDKSSKAAGEITELHKVIVSYKEL